MGSRALIAVATAASGTGILIALLTVGFIANDINTFYGDALGDMGEFKVRGWAGCA